jgi:hypothetical protein
LHLAEDTDHVVEANKAFESLLRFLPKEIGNLREAHTREVAVLRAESREENCTLREKLAKCKTLRQRENAVFRKQQDGLSAQLAQEIATLTQKLGEEIANVQRTGEPTATERLAASACPERPRANC